MSVHWKLLLYEEGSKYIWFETSQTTTTLQAVGCKPNIDNQLVQQMDRFLVYIDSDEINRQRNYLLSKRISESSMLK